MRLRPGLKGRNAKCGPKAAFCAQFYIVLLLQKSPKLMIYFRCTNVTLTRVGKLPESSLASITEMPPQTQFYTISLQSSGAEIARPGYFRRL